MLKYKPCPKGRVNWLLNIIPKKLSFYKSFYSINPQLPIFFPISIHALSKGNLSPPHTLFMLPFLLILPQKATQRRPAPYLSCLSSCNPGLSNINGSTNSDLSLTSFPHRSLFTCTSYHLFSQDILYDSYQSQMEKYSSLRSICSG